MCLARTVSPVAVSLTVCGSTRTARLLTIATLERSRLAGVGGLQPVDLVVLVGDQRRPVELRLGHRPAVAGCVLEFLGEARRIDQELLRHAAADHAGAADAILLGDHHARAVAGRNARGADAARSRADDKQIDLFRHCLCPVQRARATLRNRCDPSSSSRRAFFPSLRPAYLSIHVCARLVDASTAFGSLSMIFLPSGVL